MPHSVAMSLSLTDEPLNAGRLVAVMRAGQKLGGLRLREGMGILSGSLDSGREGSQWVVVAREQWSSQKDAAVESQATAVALHCHLTVLHLQRSCLTIKPQEASLAG